MNKLLNKLGISVTYKNGVLEIMFPKFWTTEEIGVFIYPVLKELENESNKGKNNE